VIAHTPLRAIEAAKVASELLSRIDHARKDIVIEGKFKEQTVNVAGANDRGT